MHAVPGSEALAGEALGQGGGTPLVLIHAFPFDGRMWRRQRNALGEGRPLLIPDLFGFGRTPLPAGGSSLEKQADGLARFMEEMGLGRAILCGLSMGGYVALAFAQRHRERLAGLVLADTRAAGDSEAARKARTANAARVRAEGVGLLAREMVPKLLSPASIGRSPALAAEVESLIREQAPESVAAALEAMRDRPSREGILAEAACPVLVVAGSEDALTPAAEARAMACECADAHFVEIAGAGHLSNMEAPTAFNAAVLDFAAKL